MEYCIVGSDNVIVNIIVCDSDNVANDMGAVPSYDGATIGEAYSPPPPHPTQEERIAALEDALCEQDTVTAQRMADIENALCQLDAAGKVGT